MRQVTQKEILLASLNNQSVGTQQTTLSPKNSTSHQSSSATTTANLNIPTTPPLGGGLSSLDSKQNDQFLTISPAPQPNEVELFIKMFQEMNEKAIESMNKDEPETALEFLKKADEKLKKLQQKSQNSNNPSRQNNQSMEKSAKSKQKAGNNASGLGNQDNSNQNNTGNQNQTEVGGVYEQIDPNYKASLYYNLACCYQRLGMLEECVDYLELATKALNKKIVMLEEEENALLFNNTDPNSIDAEFKQANRRQLSNNYGGSGGINSSFNNQVSSHSAKSPSNSRTHQGKGLLPNSQQKREGRAKQVVQEPKKVKRQSREKLLASKLHKLRYQCKFNLQLCAILSQINQHRDALIYGHKSANLCSKLVKEAQLLCKRFMHQIQRQIKKEQDRQCQMANQMGLQGGYGSQQQQQQIMNMSNYNTMALQTQLNSNRSNNQIAGLVLNESSIVMQQDSLNSHRNSNVNTLNNSNYSIKNNKQNLRANTALGQGIAINYIKKQKNSRRSVNSMERNGDQDEDRLTLVNGIQTQSKRSHSSQSEKIKSKAEIDRSIDSQMNSPRSSVTRLRIYKNPFVRGGDSMNESQISKYRDNSNESLERIHTFSLKNSFQKVKNSTDHTVTITDSKLLKASDKNDKSKDSKPSSLTRQSIETLLKKDSTTDDGNWVGNNKTYYVEESVKILENIIMKADPILSELASKVKQFEKVQNMTASEREQDLLDKYGQEEYDEQRKKLKISFHEEDEINDLKFNGNYKMSVRNVLGLRHSDDWIFNLNIGNVMHLSLMGAEELNAKLENTHELCKDSMLEKIVLVSVSYFCIGTEMRFLMQKQNSTITKKDSEAFHAKALHIASLFLPHDCPLVIHIVNSYVKNYLKDKKPITTSKTKRLTQDLSQNNNQNSGMSKDAIQSSRPRSRQQQQNLKEASISNQISPLYSTKQQQNQNNNQQNSKDSQFNDMQHQHQQQNSYQQLSQQQQNLSSIMTRIGRGKHQQPTQQQSQTTNLIHLQQQQQMQQQNQSRMSGSNGTMGGTDSQDDSNSNPHSIDARANRVHSTQLSHQVRPLTSQQLHGNTGNNNLLQDMILSKQNNNSKNSYQQINSNQPIQGQGGQPIQPQKLQIDVSRQINNFVDINSNNNLMPLTSTHSINNRYQQISDLNSNNIIGNNNAQQNTLDQLQQIYKLHPHSTKNQQQIIQNQFNQQQQIQMVGQAGNPNYQRFINSRPSVENPLEHNYQNYIDIDLSDDIGSISATGLQQLQKLNDQQLIQHQQQINNQLLQQQMQQLTQQQQQQSQQQQIQNQRHKQVKSQLNQISHIQMTLSNQNPPSHNIPKQQNQQQLQQEQLYQQIQQTENNTHQNPITLRHNLRTPTSDFNSQQIHAGKILSQNLHINAFNTIDGRGDQHNSNKGVGMSKNNNLNQQSQFEQNFSGNHISSNFNQQPINIQIMSQHSKQQQQNQHHLLNNTVAVGNINHLNIIQSNNNFLLSNQQHSIQSMQHQQQQQPILINPKKKLFTAVQYSTVGGAGSKMLSSTATAHSGSAARGQKAKLNITGGGGNKISKR